MLYAGVDLGGTKIACALAGPDGQLVNEQTRPTESHEGPQAVIERIARLIAELGKPAAVGLGVPGLVDAERGVTRFLPNLPTQWRDVPVAQILSSKLGCPVFLLNDARMATLGELKFGGGRGIQTMAMFTLGTGIGGGVVIDGKLRLQGGELGHQTIIPDGPLCGCGNRGCLEALASGPAIAAEGVRLMKIGMAPKLRELIGGDVEKVTPLTMASAGDSAIDKAIARAARFVSIGVANVVTAIHPELVVIGGGVAGIGAPLFDAIRAGVRRRVRMFPADDVRIEPSALGEKAGLFGGVALAMQR